MGVFTEQVQGLVSEERTKRQERQRKEQEKLFLQELEQRLYYIFIEAFTENNDIKKTYIFLTTYRNKCEILRGITRGLNEKKQDYYYYILDLKYNNILNKAKQNFFPEYNETKKQKTEPFRYILDDGEHLQPKKQKQYNFKIIFLLILPIISFYYFIKGILYPTKRKRRR